MHDFTYYAQILISGLTIGSLYALIAIGYTMVYGILRLINFAHGDMFMVAGFIMIYITSWSSGFLGAGSIVVGLILTLILTVILGVMIEKVAYKPLRSAPRMSVMISAIGVSYLLQNVALLIFGADTKSFTSVVTLPAIKLAGGEMTITGETIVTILSCIVIMINGTIALTFAIGSALGAIAGVLLCSAYPSLTPYTGSMPGIKAFVAAVFGGIGSIPGAFIGGILLGVIEILSKAYISSQMSDAIVFSVLIIVLLVKPTGILGKKINEKV